MVIRVPSGVDGRSIGPREAPPDPGLLSKCPECDGEKKVEKRDPETGIPRLEDCEFCGGEGCYVEPMP